MTTKTTTPTQPNPKSRGKILIGGLGSVARALWFLLSIPIYLLGLALLNLGKLSTNLGRLCIGISRWESAKAGTKRNNLH